MVTDKGSCPAFELRTLFVVAHSSWLGRARSFPLVPFSNPEAIADGVHRFLSDGVLMTATRKRAWKLGREMIWPVVAQRHIADNGLSFSLLTRSPEATFTSTFSEVSLMLLRVTEERGRRLGYMLRLCQASGYAFFATSV